MSEFKFGEKIEVSNASFIVTVLGINPAGQPVSFVNSDKSYNVDINGQKCTLKESLLDLILSSQKENIIITDKAIVVDITKEKKQIETEIKKKRGRPAKIK